MPTSHILSWRLQHHTIPVEFMHWFMAEVAEKGGQESAMSWDEGPRVLVKDFKDTKTWFFSTFGVVV